MAYRLASYRSWLDTLWDTFGEDRLFFGSDWPNSDHMAPLPEVFAMAHAYLAIRSTTAAQKNFWNNSVEVYHWKPRNTEQARALATPPALAPTMTPQDKEPK